MVKMERVYIQVHDPTLGQGKPHVRGWAVSSSSSSLGASSCIVQNPSIFPVCPKGTPSADYLSESWTPPGIGVALRHLSVIRRGLWVPGSPSARGSKRQSRVLSTLWHVSPSPAEWQCYRPPPSGPERPFSRCFRSPFPFHCSLMCKRHLVRRQMASVK